MTPTLSLAAGSAPNAPLAVSAQMRHLDVGGQDWYAFTTAGADSNNNPSHVLIVLHAVPDGSATFKVWTAEGLREKATEDSGHPVYAMGEGTKLDIRMALRLWTATAGTWSGITASTSAEPSMCKLGKPVRLPAITF